MDKTAQNDIALSDIVKPLLDWYEKNARALPWRKNADPYRVWVSEIMLQQTRVEAVIPYYERFMQHFPTVQSLADADEDRLLKLWEGLGYYRRARNLKKAARAIVEQHGGKFPKDYEDIRALPGIGDYTAGAIASICFDQPVAAVDGNVLRVMARLTGSHEDVSSPLVKKETAKRLEALYPEGRCGDFTQALMELGAVICLPNGVPKCGDCPLSFLCRAFRDGTQMELPVKTKKAPRKREVRTVFLLLCGDLVAIRRREEEGLLGGLWEFPNVTGDLTFEEAEEVLHQWRVCPFAMEKGVRGKHVFTHVQWDMKSYSVRCDNMPDGFDWVSRETLLAERTLPSAFRPFLRML